MSLTIKEYINKLGIACPNCEKTEGFQAWDTEIGDGWACQSPECTLCKATWDECYTLTSYADLEV